MIWQWLVSILDFMTAPLRQILPVISLPFDAGEPTGVAQSVGNKLALANWIVPVHEGLGLLALVVKFVLPAVIVYTVGNWVWRHIPELWGFGPGAG